MIKTWTEQQGKRDKLKKELRGFQWTRLELEGKIYMWKELIKNTYGTKAMIYTDMPHGTDVGNPTAQTVLQIENIQDRIKELEEELGEHMQEFEKLIKPLDADEKAILTWRYINGIYWENMESYVHYQQRQCQRIHDRAINKLIKLRETCPTMSNNFEL